MITARMRRIIEDNTIGLVATVTPDGYPSVSPKGTMVVLDDTHIAFGNIRSPQTVRNIGANPAVELNFIDVFSRQACRLQGKAAYHARGDARFEQLLPHFQKWEALAERMRGFVVVEILAASIILSPDYDAGGVEAELRRHWLEHFTNLVD